MRKPSRCIMGKMAVEQPGANRAGEAAKLVGAAHPLRAIATARMMRGRVWHAAAVVGVATALAISCCGCTPNVGGFAAQAESGYAVADVLPETADGTGADGDSSDAETAIATDGTAGENVAANTASMDFGYSDRDGDASYDANSATAVSFSDDIATVEGNGANVEGTVVTITQEGTYAVSGSCANGQIVVAAPEDAKVQIVLGGVSLTCENGPCINVQSADKAFVTLAENCANTLSDGSSWTLSGEDGEANATIYSECDLTVNGTGALTVNGTVHHGISTKDDLTVTGGTITVTAADDALHGKDSVQVNGGTLALTAGGDGIKCTEPDKADKGYISIDGGSTTVNASDDGLQASRLVRTTGGTLAVTAGDDALNSDVDIAISGGQVTIDAGDDGAHGEYNVYVSDGTLVVNDCIEGLEGQCVEIAGGDNTAYSREDGINASPADANASGEQTDTSFEHPAQTEGEMGEFGRPPRGDWNGNAGGFGGMMDVSEECNVTISGGTTTLVCTQDGDSLDSNGSLTMTGGTVYISGTTTNGNGSIDYGTSGTITGGQILALGSAGMAQTFGGESTQACIAATPNGSAGDTVTIADATGTTLIEYTGENDFGWIYASVPDMESDTGYTILVNGQEIATATATTQQQGSGFAGMGGNAPGDMGEMPDVSF